MACPMDRKNRLPHRKMAVTTRRIPQAQTIRNPPRKKAVVPIHPAASRGRVFRAAFSFFQGVFVKAGMTWKRIERAVRVKNPIVRVWI